MAISRFPFEAQITAMPPEHQYVIRNLWNAVADVQNAIPILKSQIGGKTTSSTTSSTSSGSGGGTETIILGTNTAGVTSFNNLTGAVTYMPQLGFVNLQTGVTSYTVQQSDGGGEIVLNDASPIAVTLNNAVIQVPWFSIISNQGSGTATITPTLGTINGLASLTLPGGSWVTIFFDGTNWWADSPGGTVGGVTKIVAGTNVTISPVGGTGAVTVNTTATGSAPAMTSNANGRAATYSNGYVHEWGLAGPATTGVARTTVAVTFPVAFAGVPVVNCSAAENPDSYGTAVFPCYPTNITVSGFTANLACGVTIGGGGPSNIVNNVYVNWMADYY
jgi:hypothetical protein